jgi:chromosome segregation ATPase
MGPIINDLSKNEINQIFYHIYNLIDVAKRELQDADKALTNDFNNLEKENLSERIDDIKSLTISLQNTVNILVGDISLLSSRVGQNTAKIYELEDLVTQLRTDLNTEVSDRTTADQALSDRITILEDWQIIINTWKTSVDSELADHETRIEALESAG